MDGEVAATVCSRQEDIQAPLDGLILEPARFAVHGARELTERSVEEDPVVELAAPVFEVVVTDEPRDLREARPERRPVDRHAATARRRALDDLDAVVLGGRPGTWVKRLADGLEV